jgi:BioD-like phosphotransacetylase family protein
LNNVVADTIAGLSMEFGREVDPSKLLLVVSSKRLDEALSGFARLCHERCVPQKLAGIIVTQDADLTASQIAHCNDFSIPVAATPYDTYDTVIKMDHLVAKIDTQNQDKIRRAVTLFAEHVDLAPIVGAR